VCVCLVCVVCARVLSVLCVCVVALTYRSVAILHQLCDQASLERELVPAHRTNERNTQIHDERNENSSVIQFTV